jgi:hypothetical protein
MPEKTFYQKPYKITENIGDLTPQTPALIREFGDVPQGISRTYETSIPFNGDAFAVYWQMMRDYREHVPEDHRIVWTGYCVESNTRGGTNGNSVQIGYLVKAWFVAYQVPNMDKVLKLGRG